MKSFVLMVLLIRCSAKWELIFIDEFIGESIDQNKWFIENELSSCDGNYLGEIHCKVNSEQNIRLMNGTLVLAAIRQKYLDRNYTSPKITVKQDFTYGRVEIRAALPYGKMLRPEFHLLPKVGQMWPKDGEIVIMTNIQTNLVQQRIHFEDRNKSYGLVVNDFTTFENLFDFHIYVMEWTQTQISWKFDETLLRTVNMSDHFHNNYNPFSKSFELIISLGVGGDSFPNETLTLDNVRNWNCSLLILDYVKIYQQKDQSSNERHVIDQVNKSRDSICNTIMPLIRPPEEPTPQKDNNYLTIILVSSFSILILLLIFLVIFLLIKVKSLKESNREEVYDDSQMDEFYEEIPKDMNEYAVPEEYHNPNGNDYVQTNTPGNNVPTYLNLTN